MFMKNEYTTPRKPKKEIRNQNSQGRYCMAIKIHSFSKNQSHGEQTSTH